MTTGSLRHIKAQPCRPSSSPCQVGEGLRVASDDSDKGVWKEGENDRVIEQEEEKEN